MMKKVSILGKELNIAFNLATQIAYEEISGEQFSVKSLNCMRNTVCLYAAAIVANNPGTDISFDDLAYKMTAPETAMLRAAVLETLTEWMHIPDVMVEEDSREESEEDKPRNP